MRNEIADIINGSNIDPTLIDECRNLAGEIIETITDKIDENIESMEKELLASRPVEDKKILTFHECKARQILQVEKIKEILNAS